MWKKWKESEFYKKLKQVRVNRAVYLTAIVILLALSVVLAVTVATNRAHKQDGNEQPTDTGSGIHTPGDQTGDTGNTPDTGNNQPTANPVPELSLPVSGSLTKRHSVDTQVFSQTLKDYRVHLGIDIATTEDAPVCAVADGKVEQIWEDPMMGWCIALSHSGECITVYKNLASEPAEGIAVGNEVKSGQLLGHVGDSAIVELAEEPHLHLEMTVKGLQVDPLEYFSQAVLSTLTEDTAYESGNNK